MWPVDSWVTLKEWSSTSELGIGEHSVVVMMMVHREAYYGEGFGDIHLDDVECNGDEDMLIDCPSVTDVKVCDHSQDISIKCSGKGHI